MNNNTELFNNQYNKFEEVNEGVAALQKLSYRAYRSFGS